jgi:hypothetical protein
LSEGICFIKGIKRVDSRLNGLRARNYRLREFDGGKLASRDLRREFGDGLKVKRSGGHRR